MGYAESKRLLVVDDSRVSRMMIKAMILERRPGWCIIEAAQGEEALASVAATPPDIVTIDYNMPGMNGLELAGKLKALGISAPMALFTANVQEPIRRKAEALGCRFITKPITADSIVAILALAGSSDVSAE